jgi:hypothetical protein
MSRKGRGRRERHRWRCSSRKDEERAAQGEKGRRRREQATQAGFGKVIKNSLYDIANRFIGDFGRGLLECVTTREGGTKI